MALYFVPPKKVIAVAASESSAHPATNLNIDYPSMVWRSNGLSGVYATFQLDGSAWDTVSLYGTNLRKTDSVRIRAASSAGATATSPSYDSGVQAAFRGNADTLHNLTLLSLNAPRNETFVRIDIVSTGNPDGFVQAQRFVVGLRVEGEGMDWNAEQSFEDTSELTEYRGFTYVDPFPTKIIWKFNVSTVAEDDYYAYWFPLFRDYGSKRGVLLIPDTDSAGIQSETIFGRITASPKGQAVSNNDYRLDITVKQI